MTHPVSYRPAKLKSALGGLLFFIFATGAASAAILASWDAWGNSYSADSVMTGFSANITNPDGLLNGFNANDGSTDGTFGTLSGASTVDSTVLNTDSTRGSSLVTQTPYTFVINISNSSGSSYDLNTLHLDYQDNSAWELNSIVYENALGGQTTLATDLVVASAYGGQIWSNHDIEIGGLTLASGETVKFILTLTNTNYDRRSGRIDNIAITAIPEPSVAVLAGLALLGLSFHRRR